ncbi:MAG: hypothetical protein M3203_05040 [Actinomycetota bacterium]|nr:hypothetical protein [Actinomycetota bacterium]
MSVRNKITRITRRLMVGATALTAAAASLFVSAPAAQAATTYTVTAVLEARDLEDNSWYWWDDTDEISVNFNDSKVFYSPMKLNQPKTVVVDRQFIDTLRVTVLEWDGSNAKNLGEQHLSTAHLGVEQRAQFGISNTNGYEYILKYTIKAG